MLAHRRILLGLEGWRRAIVVHRTILRWHHKAQCAVFMSAIAVSCCALFFTSYLEFPALGCELIQDLRKVAGRSQQSDGYPTEKVMGMVGGVKRVSPVNQKARPRAVFEAVEDLLAIFEESDTEETGEGAREGGSRLRFVPNQKDARCGYV